MSNIQIVRLNPGEVSEFRNLLKIFKEIFEIEEPISDGEHLRKLLSNPNFWVFVVKENERVLGGLTLYVLERYFGTKPVGYIYDVGIASDRQGQGLGKGLIAEVCKYGKECGLGDVFVEAESDDLDAVHFYRKTNFSHERNAIHFTYTFDNEE